MMHTAENSRLLAMWKARLDTDVGLISTVVKVFTGKELEDGVQEVIRHQLERLVLDAYQDRKMEDIQTKE